MSGVPPATAGRRTPYGIRVTATWEPKRGRRHLPVLRIVQIYRTDRQVLVSHATNASARPRMLLTWQQLKKDWKPT